MPFFKHCRYLLLTSFILISPTYSAENSNASIEQLYHTLHSKPHQSLSDRIGFISEAFLSKPYELGALGEGARGDYDQFPLYRTDAFDCETYVDTVLALAFATNMSSFERYIKQIRYKNGQVSFITRNHFTCLDWNKNNQEQGLVSDITTRIKDANGHSVALTARALIDKPSWYQHFTPTTIRIKNASTTEKAAYLATLKQKGQHLEREVCTMPYIPLSVLFNSQGEANMHLFKQIPNAAIIEIIRPNWDLEKQIGTHLNVSHMGFAIWKNGILFFRQASSAQQHVIDSPLIDYLREAQKNPTIRGISILVEKKPPDPL